MGCKDNVAIYDELGQETQPKNPDEGEDITQPEDRVQKKEAEVLGTTEGGGGNGELDELLLRITSSGPGKDHVAAGQEAEDKDHRQCDGKCHLFGGSENLGEGDCDDEVEPETDRPKGAEPQEATEGRRGHHVPFSPTGHGRVPGGVRRSKAASNRRDVLTIGASFPTA